MYNPVFIFCNFTLSRPQNQRPVFSGSGSGFRSGLLMMPSTLLPINFPNLFVPLLPHLAINEFTVKDSFHFNEEFIDQKLISLWEVSMQLSCLLIHSLSKNLKQWNVRLNWNLRSFCLSQNKILLFFLGHLKNKLMLCLWVPIALHF